MALIYECTFERTLERLVERFAEAKVSRVEAWTFDGEARRHAAEASLAALGVKMRFRRAYKPCLGPETVFRARGR